MKYFVLLLGVFCLCFACNHASKKQTSHASLRPFTPFPYRQLSDKELQYYHDAVADFYRKILPPATFSGAFLVAKNGQIVFESYNGFANFQTQTPITPNTPFHIASVSKTLTGMAVVRLCEQQKILLSDSLQQFFPSFPYHGITVQDLLTHRSGLPNYPYFLDTAWHMTKKASNDDMLQYMIEHKPEVYANPNKHFHYCNTNYALLALIIEKVTGKSFPNYMKDSVFTPLGMHDSFVFGINDTANYQPSYGFNTRPFNFEAIDCIYGDKNIYSTVRDLLLWDKALYNHSFVSQAFLEKALSPYSNERPSHHNYGLGWRLYIEGTHKLVYHNGWWHGNNAVFTRAIGDTVTIITLGNRYNRMIYNTRRVLDVFSTKKGPQDLVE